MELYVGLKESVKHIKEGKPAPADTPITIRQLLLYMDEETLFDYKSGGMDFKSLDHFDKWVVKAKNLNRILPEQRGVVAMQIRRGEKDYGEANSLLEAWNQYLDNAANKWTYLLIRNSIKR